MGFFDRKMIVPTKVVESEIEEDCSCPKCNEPNSVLRIKVAKSNHIYNIYRCLKCDNYILDSELRKSGTSVGDSRPQSHNSKRQEMAEAVKRIKAKRKRRTFSFLGSR